MIASRSDKSKREKAILNTYKIFFFIKMIGEFLGVSYSVINDNSKWEEAILGVQL